MRTRIVALADSLALPTLEGSHQIFLEETWPYLLDEKLRPLDAEVINCGARARTAAALLGQEFFEHVTLKVPDVLILQVGIVDCAPRLFSPLEKRLLQLPLVPEQLRKQIIGRRAARRAHYIGRDPLRKVQVAPARFTRLLDDFGRAISEQAWTIDVLVLPILANAAAMDRKSPGHSKNRLLYNQLLKEFCTRWRSTWVESLAGRELPGDHFAPDGYHLSAQGNVVVAESLETLLRGHLALGNRPERARRRPAP